MGDLGNAVAGNTATGAWPVARALIAAFSA
jgi:hypothetical protein